MPIHCLSSKSSPFLPLNLELIQTIPYKQSNLFLKNCTASFSYLTAELLILLFRTAPCSKVHSKSNYIIDAQPNWPDSRNYRGSPTCTVSTRTISTNFRPICIKLVLVEFLTDFYVV